MISATSGVSRSQRRISQGARGTSCSILRIPFESGDAAISTQIMQETYVTAMTKLGIDRIQAKRWISYLERFEVLEIAVVTIKDRANALGII